MKKCVLGLINISLLIFLSCSNDSADSSGVSELQTIKNYVSEIEDKTVWSVELEKDRLSANISSEADLLSSNVIFSKDCSRILKSYRPPVYPLFSDFGSLDISNLEYKFVSSANELCSCICNSEQEKIFSFFSSNYRFNYVFFMQELKKGWKENFYSDYPELEPVIENNDQTIQNKAPDGPEGPLQPVLRVFDDFTLGEPFYSDNLVEIPVRFYCNMGFVDVTLYMNINQEKSIYNIKIVRWGKNG